MMEELTFTFPILSCLLVVPMLGALILWFLDDEEMAKAVALGVTLLELTLSIVILANFVSDSPSMQFAERVAWVPPLGISYHLGVDGISVLFVGVTAFLTTLIVIYSWDTVRQKSACT